MERFFTNITKQLSVTFTNTSCNPKLSDLFAGQSGRPRHQACLRWGSVPVCPWLTKLNTHYRHQRHGFIFSGHHPLDRHCDSKGRSQLFKAFFCTQKNQFSWWLPISNWFSNCQLYSQYLIKETFHCIDHAGVQNNTDLNSYWIHPFLGLV